MKLCGEQNIEIMIKESTERKVKTAELINALSVIQDTCNTYSPLCSSCPLRTESGTRCIFSTELFPFEWKINTEPPEEWRAIK